MIYSKINIFQRNTLLLQGLHYKIGFNACQIYPLNLGILVEVHHIFNYIHLLVKFNIFSYLQEISTITTIVLFLID